MSVTKPTMTATSPQAQPVPHRLLAGHSIWAWCVFVIIAGGVLGGDLGLKSWSFAHVAGTPVVLTREHHAGRLFWDQYPHRPVVVVPHVLSLHLTTNTGAVFGTWQGGQWFFTLVSLIAIPVIIGVFFVSDVRARWLHIALALILAGALGNMYDRLRFEAVRDMLWLFPGSGLWPWTFNIADASLMIGVGLLAVVTWVGGNAKTTTASDARQNRTTS